MKNSKILISILLLMLGTFSVRAQYLLAMNSTYDDTYRSWDVLVEIDSVTTVEGNISITWDMNNDFTQWTYSIGEYDGTIEQTFRSNTGRWQLRSSDGTIIKITQPWMGDKSEWDIISDDHKTKMITNPTDRVGIWKNAKRSNGDLVVYTEIDGDPRDWIIEDYMNADIPFLHRLASAFISIYSSVPQL